MSRRWTRLLPAAVVPGALVGAVLVTTQAGATVDLPERSAAEVLALMGESEVEAFSGTFEQTSDLGLPALPAGIGGGDDLGAAAEVLEAVTSDHRGRVFVGGPTQLRLQVMDRFAEQNIVLNGSELWVYDSAENAAVHVDGPRASDHREGHAMPPQLAERLLEAADPTTEVSVGPNTTVAGRSAYQLVLTPRSAETLVATATVAVDGETGLPLRAAVHARGQEEPAFHVSFTELDLTAPDADLFDFTPPPGADVEELPGTHHDPLPGPAAPPDGPRPTILGEGWDSVIVLPAGALPEHALLDQLSEPVGGGRLLSTSLLNALLTDDGRVLVGSVTPERLQAAADE